MSDFEKDAIRLLIVFNALRQAWAGAHYLNGSVGNTPGNNDGMKESRTLGRPRDTSYEKLAIRTGEWAKERCPGRYEKVSGYLFQPGSTELEQLKTFIEANKSLEADSWPSFNGTGLYPRRTGGKGSAIALGEDCLGKRHFDCISFVNWVVGTTLQKKPSWDITQYESGSGVPVERFDPLPVAKVQNADIVTRTNEKRKHIGLLTASGQVVHASGEAVGVITGPYKPEKWTKLCRLKDWYLNFG